MNGRLTYWLLGLLAVITITITGSTWAQLKDHESRIAHARAQTLIAVNQSQLEDISNRLERIENKLDRINMRGY